MIKMIFFKGCDNTTNKYESDLNYNKGWHSKIFGEHKKIRGSFIQDPETGEIIRKKDYKKRRYFKNGPLLKIRTGHEILHVRQHDDGRVEQRVNPVFRNG